MISSRRSIGRDTSNSRLGKHCATAVESAASGPFEAEEIGHICTSEVGFARSTTLFTATPAMTRPAFGSTATPLFPVSMCRSRSRTACCAPSTSCRCWRSTNRRLACCLRHLCAAAPERVTASFNPLRVTSWSRPMSQAARMSNLRCVTRRGSPLCTDTSIRAPHRRTSCSRHCVA